MRAMAHQRGRFTLLSAVGGLALLLSYGSGAVRAEDRNPSDSPPSRRTDRYGDLLPTGAVARLGTLRWRAGGDWLAYAPDGKHVYVSNHATFAYVTPGARNALYCMDLMTGRSSVYWRLGTAPNGLSDSEGSGMSFRN